ncbi:MAG: acyltransferase family protein [Bacillota bacterium]
MKKNLSSLQLFRGIAAILVLLYHNAIILEPRLEVEYFWGIFSPFGAHGVDFFFVLSGFIILYAHYNDIGKAKLTSYFRKRFIRIYPVYWVIVIPLIPMLFLIPSLGAQGTETELSVLIKSFLLFPDDTPPVLGVAWTLTHEVFFYLVFGLTLILLKPKYSIPIISIWALISLLSFTGVINFKDTFYLDFIFNKYNLEFMFGMIAAYLFINYKPKFAWLLMISGVIGFVLGGINGELEILEINRVVIYGVSAFLLILGSARFDSQSNIKTPKLFLYLGDASYSIYLTHYPAIIVLLKVFTILGLDNVMSESLLMHLIALITLLGGCLFHSIIEKPLLKLVRNRTISKQTEFNQELPKAN